MLIQHNLVRFATLDEGPIARAYYECFVEDVYPLLRYGLEVQMVGKYTGSAEVSIFYVRFLMKGWQSGAVLVDAGPFEDPGYC